MARARNRVVFQALIDQLPHIFWLSLEICAAERAAARYEVAILEHSRPRIVELDGNTIARRRARITER